jgi:TetR/AcrR family transcriptional repressor of nem operon
MMKVRQLAGPTMREAGVMRMSQEDKDRSHARIVESAAKIVRIQGLERPSVADFMNAAGMTHGGFYRHFETRDDLILEAFEAASKERSEILAQNTDAYGPAIAAAIFKADYLVDGHVTHPEVGCPLAALAGDVARGSDALKAMFGAGLQSSFAALAEGMEGSDEGRRDQAVREFAMMAGAVMLARAADPETARAILAACRKGSPQGRERSPRVKPDAKGGGAGRRAISTAKT